MMTACAGPAIAGQWICEINEGAALQRERSGSWAGGGITGRDRYVVTGPKAPGPAYLVTKLGSSMPDFLCGLQDDNGFVSCTSAIVGSSNTFIINFRTMRAQEYFVGSYLSDGDKAPYITIGQCASF